MTDKFITERPNLDPEKVTTCAGELQDFRLTMDEQNWITKTYERFSEWRSEAGSPVSSVGEPRSPDSGVSVGVHTPHPEIPPTPEAHVPSTSESYDTSSENSPIPNNEISSSDKANPENISDNKLKRSLDDLEDGEDAAKKSKLDSLEGESSGTKQSPIDYVLEKQSTEMPPIVDSDGEG